MVVDCDGMGQAVPPDILGRHVYIAFYVTELLSSESRFHCLCFPQMRQGSELGSGYSDFGRDQSL